MKRYAYIKNSDVVAEAQAIDKDQYEKKQYLGPYHYIASFLNWAAGGQVLLISRHTADKTWRDAGRRTVAKVFKTMGSRRICNVLLEIRALFLIWTNLLIFRPQWILCAVEGGGPLAAGFLAARMLRVPFVHTRHMRVEVFKPSLPKKAKMKLDHWIIRRAECVLCHGPYLEDQLIQIGVDRKKLFQFRQPYMELDLKEDRDVAMGTPSWMDSYFNQCTLVYVGRIERKKGVVDLLAACEGILRMNHTVNLLYIGSGTLLETMQAMVGKIGLADRVFFVGQQAHEHALEMIRRSDILIIPTRQELGEGWCKSAIEGLILGLPVIAPDYGAFRYLVRHNENGLLYEPDNEEDLGRKISHLIESPQDRQRMSANASQSGRELARPVRTFTDALDMAAELTGIARRRPAERKRTWGGLHTKPGCIPD